MVNKNIFALGFVAAVVVAASLAMIYLIRNYEDERRNQLDTTSRLKVLGLGMIKFADDHQGRFPPMSERTRFQGALEPYVEGTEESGSDFVDVERGTPFVLNGKCSGIDSHALSDAPGLIVLYQRDPAPSGNRLALFADGHVKGVGAATWAAVQDGFGRQKARTGQTEPVLTLVPHFGRSGA